MGAAFCNEEVRLLLLLSSSSHRVGIVSQNMGDVWKRGIRFFHTRIGLSGSKVVAIAE
jgi:hypothetical protein